MSDVQPVEPVVEVPSTTAAAELTALLTDLVQKKPSTAADALALLEKVDLELVKWVVKDLPAADQKTVMASKWAVNEVKHVGLTWCVPQKSM